MKILVKANRKSDFFAEHFAKFIPKETERKEITNLVKMEVGILWKGNPLSCVKTFGTKNCKLCMQEKIEILKQVHKDPSK